MNIDLDGLDEATDLVVQAKEAVRYHHFITPVNGPLLQEEFLAAWEAGRPFNPRFEYLPVLTDAPTVIAAARSRLPHDPYWRDVLSQEVDRAESAYVALLSRDRRQITDYARHQFGTPTEDAVAQARRFLDGNAHVFSRKGSWTSSRTAEIIRVVLALLGLTDWSVDRSHHLSGRVIVLGSQQRVRVAQDAAFGAAEIRRLMVHEIGTHVLRSANGQRQPARILGHGIGDYLGTEEGLASWHEQLTGVTDTNVMRRDALRVVACHAALRGDFCSVFGAVHSYTSPGEAYALTVRVKRGLLDTSEPGGHIQDHVYLSGYLDIAAHLAEHPDDYYLLMATGWPLSKIGALRDLRAHGMLVEPAFALDEILRHAETVMYGPIRRPRPWRFPPIRTQLGGPTGWELSSD